MSPHSQCELSIFSSRMEIQTSKNGPAHHAHVHLFSFFCACKLNLTFIDIHGNQFGGPIVALEKIVTGFPIYRSMGVLILWGVHFSFCSGGSIFIFKIVPGEQT